MGEVKRQTAGPDHTNTDSAVQPAGSKHTRFRAIKTAILVLTFVGMGMRAAMVSTTLPDQRMRLNATTAQMSYAISIGAVGSILGAPIGVLADRYGNHVDPFICLLLLLTAVLNALRGLVIQVKAYALCLFFEGLLYGSLPPMCNSVILAIWGAHNTRAIQALHIGMPLGQVIGPLITIPFVSDKPEQPPPPTPPPHNATDSSPGYLGIPALVSSLLHHTIDTQDYDDRFPDKSQIEIAFWIVSAFMVVVALLFIVMECRKTGDVKKKVNVVSNPWRDIVRPSYWAEGHGKFGIVFFLLMALFFIMYIACAAAPTTYLTVYAVDSGLGFTHQDGALLTSVFHLSGLLARLAAILLLGRVANLTIMWVLVHAMLVAAVLYATWGAYYKVGYWVCTILFGAVHRPMWGACYAWANDYILLMAAVIAALNLVHNLSCVPVISLYGYLYDATVIQSVFYMCCLYGGLACLAWYLLYYVGRRHGTRSERAVKRDATLPEGEVEAKREAIANGVVGVTKKCETETHNGAAGKGAAGVSESENARENAAEDASGIVDREDRDHDNCDTPL